MPSVGRPTKCREARGQYAKKRPTECQADTGAVCQVWEGLPSAERHEGSMPSRGLPSVRSDTGAVCQVWEGLPSAERHEGSMPRRGLPSVRLTQGQYAKCGEAYRVPRGTRAVCQVEAYRVSGVLGNSTEAEWGKERKERAPIGGREPCGLNRNAVLVCAEGVPDGVREISESIGRSRRT
jgi:hypothetical protein